MQEIRLTIKRRDFPSRGRVRLNVVHLPLLGVVEGGSVELINEATGKTLKVVVIADTMVVEGQIRVSEEDLAALGLLDTATLLVRKAAPLQDKIGKAAADTNVMVAQGVDQLDRTLRKMSEDVTAEAAKAAETMKQEMRKASGKVEEAAAKTPDT
jgi:hypothetical protein